MDCASIITAPAAATALSDFGAKAIKIEPRGQAIPYRNLPNLPGYPHSERNFCWRLEPCNERSLALDLSRWPLLALLAEPPAETSETQNSEAKSGRI